MKKFDGLTPPHQQAGIKQGEAKKGHHYMDGLPVKDANHPLVLNIKTCDIQGSKKADASNCAAARALKRELGSQAKVYLTRTYVKVGKVWARFITPQSISREIVAFDRGAQFEPGEYVLNPPSKKQRLGIKRKSGASGKHTGNGKKVRHITASVRQMKDKE